MDREKIKEMVSRYPEFKGNLIAILYDLQTHYGYLPEEELRYLAKIIGVPLSRLYSIATFYHFFSLYPQGRHRVQVCLGTACHVKGSTEILAGVEKELGAGAGETSSDGQFTLAAVRCVGACSLAPVMVVDKDTHGKVTARQIKKILKKYA